MSDYWERYEGILTTDENGGYDIPAFTEDLVVEGVLDNGSYGDSEILIAGLDLDYVFKALQGEKVRVTIKRLGDS